MSTSHAFTQSGFSLMLAAAKAWLEHGVNLELGVGMEGALTHPPP